MIGQTLFGVLARGDVLRDNDDLLPLPVGGAREEAGAGTQPTVRAVVLKYPMLALVNFTVGKLAQLAPVLRETGHVVGVPKGGGEALAQRLHLLHGVAQYLGVLHADIHVVLSIEVVDEERIRTGLGDVLEQTAALVQLRE